MECVLSWQFQRRSVQLLDLGITVVVVLTITVPVNNLIYSYVLKEGALAWAGIPDSNLVFLSLISYIGIIAAIVQMGEPVRDYDGKVF